MVGEMLSIEQLNMLFGNSKDFVFLCERAGDDYIYRFVNEATNPIFGNENVIGKSIKNLKLDAVDEIILKYYDLALDTQEHQSFQDYSSYALEMRKYETSVTPINQGSKQYVLAITKEIAIDRDVQDKYLFVRSLFYKTIFSTVLVTRDLKLLEANTVFLTNFNLTIEQARGKDFLELQLFDQEMMQQFHESLLDMNDEKHAGSKVLKFQNANGQVQFFMATFTPLLQEERVAAICLILQDLTKYMEQEKVIEHTRHVLENFKHAINSAADISITDEHGTIIDVNERFVQRTGYHRHEIIGQTHHLVNSRYHSKEFFVQLWKSIASGQVWRGEICNRDKNGVTYWNDTTIIPLFNRSDKITQYLGVHVNISDKKMAIAKLHHIEKTFRLITENTNDLIIVTDDYGMITYVSPSYVRLLGYREDELVGRFYDKIVHEDSKQEWDNISIKEKHKGVEIRIELKLQAKTGETFWTEAHCKVVDANSMHNKYQIIMLSREMTERKNRENQLLFMAYHDSLTKLPNRSYMFKEFTNLATKADAQFESVALVYIDGDDFKTVNDRFGHDVGDEFLKKFSRALLKCVRLNDLIVRLGGDEFVILLTGLSRDEVVRRQQLGSFVKRVQDCLLIGWEIDGILFTPTSSMGIAFYPDHSTALENLLELADQALYSAKKTCKNSYQIYS